MSDSPAISRDTWWSRPGGGREVLSVSAPLVVSAMSWTVMTFVDRVLLKGVSGEAMSAAFSASTLWFTALCLPLGICMYASTFVSQYFGAGQPERIGPSVWQGVWVALLASPLMLLTIPLAPAMFAAAGHGAETMRLEIIYFQVLMWGAPAMLLAQSFSAFYSGRGRTRVVMLVDALFAVVNLLLDYAWIYGEWGFPEMGIAGAGWATVVSLWLKAATYVVLLMLPANRAQFATLSGMRLDWPLFKRVMYYGGPSGYQLALDVTGFTVFIMLVGRLGAVEAEATSMAFSISTLAFMPIFGLSMGASILVGQHLGEDRDEVAARSTWTSLHVALAYMATVSLMYVAVPDLYLRWFFLGEERGQVYDMAVTLLRFVAAYNLLDATLMVFVSAIKGAGDTQFVLWVSLIMSTLLSAASWVAVTQIGLGIYGCWVLITAWIWILGVIFLMRFLGGKWRSMRVIEKAPPDLADSDGELEPSVA
ncbi:Multidrug resistance protein NorM [Posidoniimonas polymericola]|uniref:Multidrug-efflux transporter n=1 Tax=Posidoniimonas polymericola TaxID=2528002 RepID=A0A5C5ZCT4_9BACT|nr:MATE family efflux transporter [Posidoniimonas polymericola]TWT85219.1 Multidrug resistance protein NorM [Posidoniimonas polymericola]